MKKLNKSQVKERDALMEKLADTSTSVETALTEYNEAVAEAHAKFIEVWESYKEVRQEAYEFLDEIVTTMGEYEAERSEKWTDSEAGERYVEWRQSYESAREECNIPDDPEPPEELDLDYEGRNDTLGELADSPEDM